MTKTTDNTQGTSTEVIPCSLKLLPQDQWIPASETAVRINPANKSHLHQLKQAISPGVLSPEHLALLTGKRWPVTGVSLTVSFTETVDPALSARILSHMNAWGTYCNAKFTLIAANGQVRISLAGSGYWSYLGIDILHIPAGQPTMNLQGFSMTTPESEYHRVVRHETGHTMGFPHEHMRSEIVSRIDPIKAKAYFLATQGWDDATVTAQVLTPLDNSALIETAHADPNSIMCYWLPASIMTDSVAVTGGTDIDQQDQQFAGQVYPLPPKKIEKFEHKEIKIEIKEKVEARDKIAKLEHKEKDEKIERKETKEKPEKNEHKEKPEKNEQKEKPEKIEQKEKPEKNELKEKPEKIEQKEKPEKNEQKEKPEKTEFFEHKPIKEIDNKLNEGFQNINPGPAGFSTQAPFGLEERVQQLEAMVTSLTSFIDQSLRPDLSKGALSNE